MRMERAGRTGTAAILREVGGALQRTEIVCDALRPDELLVRMAGAGICHTDLLVMDGVLPVPLPVVLGHEGAGVVIERGSAVTALEPGDHVVLSFDACRTCRACHRGLPGYCTHARELNYACKRSDGTTTLRDAAGPVHGGWFGQSSLASLAVASERNAVRVPRSSELALLAPLGCGIQTGAGTVLRVLKPSPGQGIAIFGVGGVGVGALMAAVAARCSPVVVIDPLPSRRQLALELGATHALAPDEVGERGSALRKVLGGALDFCVDTVGTQAVITQALHALGTPGVCATLALRGGANPVSISQTHLLYGRTLVGVIEGDSDPQVLIPELVRMWRAGELPLERVIRTFPFERLDEALASMRDGSVVKPVVTFGGVE